MIHLQRKHRRQQIFREKFIGESYERTVIAVRYPVWSVSALLRKKDVTDIDYNGRELWIRDIHNIRHKVTDEKIRQRLNEEFIQSFATNVANLVGKNLTPTDNVIEAETEELRITVIHESVASTGTCICIRKTPPVQRITPKKALEEHYCEEKVLHLLANCVKAKLNMVFCGEPGVGKTECAKF